MQFHRQDRDLPGSSQVTWSIFSPEGHWLSGMVLPRSFRVLEIGRDHLVALTRDELDVERVQVLRLRKPAGFPPA